MDEHLILFGKVCTHTEETGAGVRCDHLPSDQMRHVEANDLAGSIETILGLIGLIDDRQTLSKNLSGGMKRRLSIGISLIGDPKVLLFFTQPH